MVDKSLHSIQSCVKIVQIEKRKEEMNMKKFFAILLSAMLMLSLAVPAMAADETYTITINNKLDGHTYEAYQIFTGDLNEAAENDVSAGTNAVLSNIKWGSGIDDAGKTALLTFNGTAYESAAELAKALTSTNIAAFADAVVPYRSTAAATSTDKGDFYEIANLEPGYYLVMDAAAGLTGYDVKTSYIIEVVENSTVTPKSEKPSVDKQVWDEITDAETDHTNGWGETADHAINESFQFKLIATLPEDADFAAYETYKIVFSDTMSAGITFESIASVKVNDTKVEVKSDANPHGYYLNGTDVDNLAGITWTLTIDDIKKHDTDLTNGAIIEVIYNAHLNEDAQIENEPENKNTVNLQYSNNPNAGGGNELGKTPDDHVWVFTYTMANKKVDGNEQPLAGAGFRLYGDEACQTEIPVVYDDDLGAYRLAKTGEPGEEMFSAAKTGVFNIVGLDVGTYYLKETTTPAGYNTCPVVKVEITATHAEEASKESATTKIVMKQDGTETDANKVVNKAGSVLPETGGMGTTIFYIVGGIMVVAAVVLLVTKKRMSAEG